MLRRLNSNISRKIKGKSYRDYIESKLMVPNVEYTLLIWSSNKKSNSRRSVAVEILLWLQYIYSKTTTVRAHWPQLISPWLQGQDHTWQGKTRHPAVHFPSGARQYKPGDELDVLCDRAPGGASPAQSPCPTTAELAVEENTLLSSHLHLPSTRQRAATSMSFYCCPFSFFMAYYGVNCIVHLTTSHFFCFFLWKLNTKVLHTMKQPSVK